METVPAWSGFKPELGTEAATPFSNPLKNCEGSTRCASSVGAPVISNVAMVLGKVLCVESNPQSWYKKAPEVNSGPRQAASTASVQAGWRGSLTSYTSIQK